MAKFQVGDRVKGLYAHKGKTGSVVEANGNSIYVCVQWDNGKRKAWVDSARLEKIGDTPLALLSKEDLIRVIAEMHETVNREWHSQYGLPNKTADTLHAIGNLCLDHCLKNDLSGLPDIQKANSCT